jgi:hypothetical protein
MLPRNKEILVIYRLHRYLLFKAACWSLFALLVVASSLAIVRG